MNKNIKRYIKDSLFNNRIRRWDKPSVNIYVTPIHFSLKDLPFSECKKLIKNAANAWNFASKSRISLNIIDTTKDADIIIYWRRNTSSFCGVCNYDNVVNGRLKSVSLTIGIGNEFLEIPPDKDQIYCTILHELGHALGLGHSDEKGDIMHPSDFAMSLTQRDMTVLKILYSFCAGMSEKELFKRLEDSSYFSTSQTHNIDQDVVNFMDILGKHNLIFNTIRAQQPV